MKESPGPRRSGRPHQSFYAKHEAVILGSLSVVLIIGAWQQAGRPALYTEQPRPLQRVRSPQ